MYKNVTAIGFSSSVHTETLESGPSFGVPEDLLGMGRRPILGLVHLDVLVNNWLACLTPFYTG